METKERPEIVTDEMLVFLDELRADGCTNMFGASPCLMDNFYLEKHEAKKVLLYWMETFGTGDR